MCWRVVQAPGCTALPVPFLVGYLKAGIPARQAVVMMDAIQLPQHMGNVGVEQELKLGVMHILRDEVGAPDLERGNNKNDVMYC